MLAAKSPRPPKKRQLPNANPVMSARSISGNVGPHDARLFRELVRALRESGLRKPYWRVFKKEKPKCGARCRNGHPCQAPAAWDEYRCGIKNGRCRIHGGLSTGPRTEEGRRRCAEAARRRWEGPARGQEVASNLSLPPGTRIGRGAPRWGGLNLGSRRKPPRVDTRPRTR